MLLLAVRCSMVVLPAAFAAGDFDNETPLDYTLLWGSGPPIDGQPGPGGNWCDPGFPNQSPIDITDENIVHAFEHEPLDVTVNIVAETALFLTSNGVELELEGNWLTLRYRGQTYEADQIHFHSPSEHVFNGFHCAGGVHVVMHNTASEPSYDDNGIEKDKNTVISFCQQIGVTQGSFLDALTASVPARDLQAEITRGWVSDPMFNLDLSSYQSALDGDYFTYLGSYTTPGCNPNINWIVMKNPVPMLPRVMEWHQNLFKAPANYRPLQAVGDRKITHHHICDCDRRRNLLFGVPPLGSTRSCDVLDGCDC